MYKMLFVLYTEKLYIIFFMFHWKYFILNCRKFKYISVTSRATRS